MSTEQIRAWGGLLISTVMVAISIYIIVTFKEMIHSGNSTIMYMIFGIICIGGIAQLINVFLTRISHKGSETTKDERDIQIENKAMYGQCWTIIIGTWLWCIILPIFYPNTIPTMYMMIIAITVPIANLFGKYLSMLVFYYKEETV